jgi:hypothetical protein
MRSSRKTASKGDLIEREMLSQGSLQHTVPDSLAVADCSLC